LRDHAGQAELVLRLFEKALLRETGYGLVLDHDAETQIPIDPEALYIYHPDRGPVRAAAGHHRSGDGIRLRGSSLLALHQESLDDPRSQREAKTLLRALLMRQLDGRPLHTRELFRRVVSPFISPRDRQLAP